MLLKRNKVFKWEINLHIQGKGNKNFFICFVITMFDKISTRQKLLRYRLTLFLLRIGLIILVLVNDKGRVFFFRDAHVVAGIILLHDVPRPRVQQNRVFVELGQLSRSNANQSNTVSDV